MCGVVFALRGVRLWPCGGVIAVRVQALGLPFTSWLPQRRWTLYMFFALFLWQNPLLVATQLLRDVPDSVRLATALMQGIRCARLPTACARICVDTVLSNVHCIFPVVLVATGAVHWGVWILYTVFR